VKLWMIMTIFGINGSVIGPLPYDLKECMSRASEEQKVMRSLLAATDKKIEFDEQKVEPKDIKWHCVLSDARPQVRE